MTPSTTADADSKQQTRSFYPYLTALGLALSLTGCAGQKLKVDPAVTVAPEALAPSNQAEVVGEGVGESYLIGALDILTVRVIGYPEFDAPEAQVDFSGHVQLPLVGSVPALGRSPQQLSGELTTAFEQTYLRKPKVFVTVKEIKSRFITIEGEVKNPGLIPIPTNLTLTRALALGQGMTEFAAPNKVAVFRKVDGKQMAAIFDIQDIRRGAYADPLIYPNDVVVVGTSQVRRIFRDIIQIAPFVAVFRPFG